MKKPNYSLELLKRLDVFKELTTFVEENVNTDESIFKGRYPKSDDLEDNRLARIVKFNESGKYLKRKKRYIDSPPRNGRRSSRLNYKDAWMFEIDIVSTRNHPLKGSSHEILEKVARLALTIEYDQKKEHSYGEVVGYEYKDKQLYVIFDSNGKVIDSYKFKQDEKAQELSGFSRSRRYRLEQITSYYDDLVPRERNHYDRLEFMIDNQQLRNRKLGQIANLVGEVVTLGEVDYFKYLNKDSRDERRHARVIYSASETVYTIVNPAAHLDDCSKLLHLLDLFSISLKSVLLTPNKDSRKYIALNDKSNIIFEEPYAIYFILDLEVKRFENRRMNNIIHAINVQLPLFNDIDPVQELDFSIKLKATPFRTLFCLKDSNNNYISFKKEESNGSVREMVKLFHDDIVVTAQAEYVAKLGFGKFKVEQILLENNQRNLEIELRILNAKEGDYTGKASLEIELDKIANLDK